VYGVHIYGSPWQPRGDNWAFNLERGEQLLAKWNAAPSDIDVLLTHTPPLGHGDLTASGTRVGCVELLNSVVKRIRPKYHVFGQLFDGALNGVYNLIRSLPTGYGCTSDGYTKFINCTLCDANSKLVRNEPVIFDIKSPQKEAETKTGARRSSFQRLFFK
jgi:hypothetical protein